MRDEWDFLKRLRGLPEAKKKIIVWGITIGIGVGLLAWWVPRVGERMQIPQGSSIQEQLRLEELRERVGIPDMKTPFQSNNEQ